MKSRILKKILNVFISLACLAGTLFITPGHAAVGKPAPESFRHRESPSGHPSGTSGGDVRGNPRLPSRADVLDWVATPHSRLLFRLAREPVTTGQNCCHFVRKHDGALEKSYPQIEDFMRENFFNRPFNTLASKFLMLTNDSLSINYVENSPNLKRDTFPRDIDSKIALEAAIIRSAQEGTRTLFVLGHRENENIVFFGSPRPEEFKRWEIPIRDVRALGVKLGVNVLVWTCESGKFVGGGMQAEFDLREVLRGIDRGLGEGKTVIDFLQSTIDSQSRAQTIEFDAAELLVSTTGTGLGTVNIFGGKGTTLDLPVDRDVARSYASAVSSQPSALNRFITTGVGIFSVLSTIATLIGMLLGSFWLWNYLFPISTSTDSTAAKDVSTSLGTKDDDRQTKEKLYSAVVGAMTSDKAADERPSNNPRGQD